MHTWPARRKLTTNRWAGRAIASPALSPVSPPKSDRRSGYTAAEKAPASAAVIGVVVMFMTRSERSNSESNREYGLGGSGRSLSARWSFEVIEAAAPQRGHHAVTAGGRQPPGFQECRMISQGTRQEGVKPVDRQRCHVFLYACA